MKSYSRFSLIALLLVFSLSLQSCSENYSNGERIGLVTSFAEAGLIWKSHEGHLNVTQTGMNSSVPFDFSIDNDHEPEGLAKTLDSAASLGWKVKLTYHLTRGKNWFGNRGNTSYFVTGCQVLDRSPITTVLGGQPAPRSGRVVDTIYVVIDRSK